MLVLVSRESGDKLVAVVNPPELVALRSDGVWDFKSGLTGGDLKYFVEVTDPKEASKFVSEARTARSS